MNTLRLFARSAFSFIFLVSSVFAYSVPDEVKNVTATEVDGNIQLRWDAGSSPDDVITGYRIYFGTKSVKTAEDYYDSQIEVNAQTTYSFENLTAGTPYYFAITAIDSQENESATYSPEISFTLPSEEIVEESSEPEVQEDKENVVEETTPVVEETETPKEEPVEQPQNIETPFGEGNVSAAESSDNIAPLDASSLQINTDNIKSENKVTLTWTKSRDLDYDVSDQVLFVRVGSGQWDTGRSLGADLEIIDLDVEANQSYEVKIVTIDESDNESVGITETFSTNLTESGPASMVSLFIAIGALFILTFFFQRKRI